MLRTERKNPFLTDSNVLGKGGGVAKYFRIALSIEKDFFMGNVMDSYQQRVKKRGMS